MIRFGENKEMKDENLDAEYDKYIKLEEDKKVVFDYKNDSSGEKAVEKESESDKVIENNEQVEVEVEKMEHIKDYEEFKEAEKEKSIEYNENKENNKIPEYNNENQDFKNDFNDKEEVKLIEENNLVLEEKNYNNKELTYEKEENKFSEEEETSEKNDEEIDKQNASHSSSQDVVIDPPQQKENPGSAKNKNSEEDGKSENANDEYQMMTNKEYVEYLQKLEDSLNAANNNTEKETNSINNASETEKGSLKDKETITQIEKDTLNINENQESDNKKENKPIEPKIDPLPSKPMKLLVKKNTIEDSELGAFKNKSIEREEEVGGECDSPYRSSTYSKSLNKSKKNFYSLKVDDKQNTFKGGVYPFDKFTQYQNSNISPTRILNNNTAYLYKKENKLTQEKLKRENQANFSKNMQVKNMAKTQLKEFKNKKTLNLIKIRNNTAKPLSNNLVKKDKETSSFRIGFSQKNRDEKRGFSSLGSTTLQKYEEQKHSFLQL